MASYPGATKSFTTKTDGPSQTIFASHVNDLQDEVVAVENGLRTGLAHDVIPDATANNRDLGTSGAKFRDLNISRNAAIGGTVTVTGGQIAFPATQAASTDANTLDDYEEGSWTPAVASSGGGAATYTVQVGGYVKVGKRVDFWARITLATKGTLAAGNVTITGLPFTSENTTNLIGFSDVPFFNNMTTSVTRLSGFVLANTAVLELRYVAGVATGVSQLTVADISATFDIVIGGSYRASA